MFSNLKGNEIKVDYFTIIKYFKIKKTLLSGLRCEGTVGVYRQNSILSGILKTFFFFFFDFDGSHFCNQKKEYCVFQLRK